MAAEPTENQLGISWHDSAWIPVLNPANVLEYFSQKTNPFYDRTCNNEVVKMQRLDPSSLQTMTGIEYVVLHVQDPILYVIRKQHRLSPTQERKTAVSVDSITLMVFVDQVALHNLTTFTPISDYYMLAGVVYQAPDLCSVINSRLLSALHHIQSAFVEATSYSRYHPSKGYWWQFKDKQKRRTGDENNKIRKTRPMNDPNKEASSLFQREGVHMLLGELSRKFPPQFLQQGQTVGGITKKNPEKKSGEETSCAKDTMSAEPPAGMEPVPDSTPVPGGLGTTLSRGPSNTQLSLKRGASSDPVTKQPPGKKKKI